MGLRIQGLKHEVTGDEDTKVAVSEVGGTVGWALRSLRAHGRSDVENWP